MNTLANFLEITQRVRQECGISGVGPTTVVAQTGELQRIVDWVNDAWIDVQMAHQDWQWLRKSASFITIAGTPTYTPVAAGVTDFGMWARDTFRNYLTSTGVNSEISMDYMPYEAWRDTYQINANRSVQTRPIVISIAPDKSICLGPYPAAGYTITGDYYSVPSRMSLDADVPTLPSQFRLAIVNKALMYYGSYESAPEVYARGEAEFSKIMARMNLDRLPEVGFAGALA